MTNRPIGAGRPGGGEDLAELTVRDVMSRDVVSVGPDMPVSELVEVLAEEGISGLPVVDADEVCVGVVSTTDVSRAVLREERGDRSAAESDENGLAPGDGERGGGFFRLLDAGRVASGTAPARLPLTRLGARAVRDIMTPATFSVRPDATLPELAGFLIRSEVRRALVFENRRLVGVVTGNDVLRAVAALEAQGSEP